MISYCFLHGEHKLNVQKHGYRKIRNQPYVCTETSTLTDIQTTSQTIQPEQVASHIYQQRGGISTESVSQLTRSRQQVKDSRRYISGVGRTAIAVNKDLLLDVMMMEESAQSPSDKFVRAVTAFPEPMCVLATEQQLVDMERFCVDCSPNCSILGVDPTFNCGKFYVTVSTYNHLLLNNSH